jgi:transposase
MLVSRPAKTNTAGLGTSYNWLTRLDTDESLEQAVTDANRPGRPRKLPETDRDEFEETLQNEPRAVGYDAPAWTPELVQRHLQESYDPAYPIPSCRRLLKKRGVLTDTTGTSHCY